MNPDFIIKTAQLSKKYNKGKANEVIALQDINVNIAPQTINLLKGASGSGKTTLLSLLSCLARPTSGEYEILGENVSRWSEKFLTRFRQKNIGIIFQQFQLIAGFNAFVNIALPLYPLKLSNKLLQEKVESAAEMVNISHRLNFPVKQLSGGEMQRVAIARALVNQPAIIMADEPTSHLDTDTSLLILKIFKDLKNQGKTLLITTHDPRIEQNLPIDQVLMMKDGRIMKTV